MTTDKAMELLEWPVDRIRVVGNARTVFDAGELEELARSLVDSGGALQPGRGWREGEWVVLLAGERRWRAHSLAGLAKMWVMVGPEPTESEKVKWNLVENLQRANLRPLETVGRVCSMLSMVDEATGMPLWSESGLAEELGKSRAWVGNCVAAGRAGDGALAALGEGRVSLEVVGLIGSLPVGLRERACVEMIDRPFGGAMSAGEAARHVAENFRRDLRRAEFDGEDADLVRGAPVCSGCEWYGGNREDVRGKARGSVCLNPVCFESKVAAHAGRRREQVSEEVGTVVLDAGAARGLFQPWNGAVDPSSGYVDCADKPDAYLLTESARNADRGSLPTWEQVVAGREVPVKVCFHEGKERRLMEVGPAVMAARLSVRWGALFKGDSGADLLTVDERKAKQRRAREGERARLSALVEGCGELLGGLLGVFDNPDPGGLRDVVDLAMEGNLQREDVGFLCRVLSGDATHKGDSAECFWGMVDGLVRDRGQAGYVAVLVLVLRCRALRYHGYEGADWELGAPLARLGMAAGFPLKSWAGKLKRRVAKAEADGEG